MEKLVTAVIITYKREPSVVQRAIESVIAQTYSPIELIVVNDAPEAIEIRSELEKYISSVTKKNVEYIVHERNFGANAARNTGLAHAKGEYIAFLDDDDEWAHDKIEIQISAIRENVAMVYGDFVINENGKETLSKNRLPDNPLNAILEGNYIGSTSFPLLLTSAVREVGGFDDSLSSCQEYDLWIRLISKYKVCYTNKKLGVYYYSADSTFKKPIKYINGIEALLVKHGELYKKHPRQLSNRLIGLSYTMLKKNEYKQAAKYKIRAFIADPLNPSNISVVYIIQRMKKKGNCRLLT